MDDGGNAGVAFGGRVMSDQPAKEIGKIQLSIFKDNVHLCDQNQQ